MTYTRAMLTGSWEAAAKSGTLLQAKHDPNNGIVLPTSRTVVSTEVSSSLPAFVTSGNFSIVWYTTSDPKHASTPDLFIVTPASGCFNDVGAFIPRGASAPTRPCDRLMFLSGSNSPWHVCAEESQRITMLSGSGKWTLQGQF